MDYSYYYEAARHALDIHASMISAENMEWLKGLPYQKHVEDSNVLLCHGSPVRLEEFEYIFAPEQARECLAIWDDLNHITLTQPVFRSNRDKLMLNGYPDVTGSIKPSRRHRRDRADIN